jgi:S-formylglutathione hydrolase FrmB
MRRRVCWYVLALLILLPSARPTYADLFGRVTEGEVFAQKIAGNLVKTAFASTALRGTRTLYVYLPPDYSSSGNKTYPVIVLLHGTPGGQLDWPGRGSVMQTLEKAIQSGQMPGAILVFPDGHGPYWKGGSEWADDIAGRCRMDTAITQDLPRFLREHFRVSPDHNAWTLGGLSEGGYGAANLVVRHPDVYRNALVFSGDLRVQDSWGDDEPIFGELAANRAANSPADAFPRLSAAERRKLRFYVAVGEDDDIDLQNQGVSFITSVRALGGEGRFVRERGKHNWGFWSSQFAASLTYLSRWLSEARA